MNGKAGENVYMTDSPATVDLAMKGTEGTTRGRHRVCAAIFAGDRILMVQHRDEARTYWTLPGGGVEAGETAEAAIVREVREETELEGHVVRFLFSEGYAAGTCDCYLVRVTGDTEARLGEDPEETHLPASARLLQNVAWLPLSAVQQDGQVRPVLAALTPEERLFCREAI